MKFELSASQKDFLALALKVASKKASSKEQIELELFLKDNPNYQREFREIQRELSDDEAQEIMVSALRVALGNATSREKTMIDSLKHRQPEKWEKVQDAIGFLEALASRAQPLEPDKPQPMPPEVRKELLASLKAVRQARGRR